MLLLVGAVAILSACLTFGEREEVLKSVIPTLTAHRKNVVSDVLSSRTRTTGNRSTPSTMLGAASRVRVFSGSNLSANSPLTAASQCVRATGLDGTTVLLGAQAWPPPLTFQTGWKRSLGAQVAREACWFPTERTLPALFNDVPAGGIVWLGFSNTAFRDLAFNWVAHIYRLQKESQLVIAAMDKEFSGLLLQEGIPHFDFDYGMKNDMRSSVVGFRRVGALKAELVLKVLRAKRHLLLSDMDVVWLADPEPILRTMWTADVMSATDCLSINGDESRARSHKGVNRCAYKPGNSEGHAAFNTGVLFFRSTVAAAAVAAAWRSRLISVEESKWLDDQVSCSFTTPLSATLLPADRKPHKQLHTTPPKSTYTYTPFFSLHSTSWFGTVSATTPVAPSKG